MTTFKQFWDNYPDNDPCNVKDKKGDKLFGNQCAIRLNYSMKKLGVSFTFFPQKRKCWVHAGADHILTARELADWLEKSNHSSFLVKEDITGSNWRGKISGRTGILCFEDYYLRSDGGGGGGGGDHIDLWNGSSMAGFGSYLRIMFNIVIPSVWSDLSKSKKIRFFPVK